MRRIEFCHTPKYGSRLRIAGCDLNAMTRQCAGGHPIMDMDESRRRIAACSADVNVRQDGVEWGVTIHAAHRKLVSVNPKVSMAKH